MDNLKDSSLTTRLYLEGNEVDLTQVIDIANTYAISDVKNIGSKYSNYTKTIKIPGTANNNKLMSFLYDIKSAQQTPEDSGGFVTAAIENLSIDGTIIVGANMNIATGSALSLPVGFGGLTAATHNAVSPSDLLYIDVSGNTSPSSYVVCYLNNLPISSNSVTSGIKRYYFPPGAYAYNDKLRFRLSILPVKFGGNISTGLSTKKKMRAYVVQDNAVILAGYAKIISASIQDGAIEYSLQITSDLGGFISSLANLRLEDLYTNTVPDLSLDPAGVLYSKTVDLSSPYDHIFNLTNVNQSWYNLVPYVYPLIDYGNDDTVGQTNFYTSNLRPCIHAKDYFDKIFSNAGYTYSSTFLNSTYFSNLIIPYKDGNINIIDILNVQVANNATSGTTTIPNVVTAPANSFYIFNNVITDTFRVYGSGTTTVYNCRNQGTYNISASITANYTLNPTGAGVNVVGCPEFNTYIIFEIFPASGGTSPVSVYQTIYDQPQFGVTVLGNPAFAGTQTSDNFIISVSSFPVFVAQAGSTIKVRIASTAPHNTAGTFFPNAAAPSTTYAGNAVMNIIYDPVMTGIQSVLNIQYSENLDGQTLHFKDFVPKSVKQIDYVNSIIKLFNLYPVQDPSVRNKFNIYTRDEFYSNQTTLDWTNKIDNLSDITVTTIPELDASQLLFSYKDDAADWFNKQYNSLYGNFSYGALRIQTGYQFANKVDNVLDPLIFDPTPIVEAGTNTAASESDIEILNTRDIVTFPASDLSSNIILAAGYYAANGTFSPYQNELSVPVSNNFSGTKFSKAKVGVHILYWGIEYIISAVFNDYAFQVTDVNGNATELIRPITAGSQHRINDVYYATNDGFTYLTNSNISIPAIYDSSDNNITHKPIKTEMKILYFQPLTAFTAASYNAFYLQYTPVVQNGIYTYQISGTNPMTETRYQYPFCSHLNDPLSPTFDLLFAKPVSVFFRFPFDGIAGLHATVSNVYPTNNLYVKFYSNTVNEILDADCKFVDCTLNLTSVDISNLDLSKIIYINGTNYRINKISDYNPDASLTQVELIRLPKQLLTGTNPPLIFAGADQIISGVTSTNFVGVATPGDPFGSTIVSTLWTQVGGPSGATISNPGSLSSLVSNMVSGNTYTFNLFGQDSYGQVGNDQVNIFPWRNGPCAPLVSATATPSGGTLAVFNPTFTLDGFATFCPGRVYGSSLWTLTSGPGTVTITTPASLSTSVSGITVAGDYLFNLTVYDDIGMSGTTNIAVHISPSYTVSLTNSFSTAGISSATGIAGLTFTSGNNVPFTGTGVFQGTHSALSSATIQINTTGTIPAFPIGAFHARLKINGVPFGTVYAATNGGTYVWAGVSCSATDLIEFTLST